MLIHAVIFRTPKYLKSHWGFIDNTPIKSLAIAPTSSIMSNFLNQDFGSEDEEDDFNPVNYEDSDAEEPPSKVGSLLPSGSLAHIVLTYAQNSQQKGKHQLSMAARM